MCGLPKAKYFSDLIDIMPAATIAKLQSIYNDVNDIDLWVGGLADNKRVAEAIVGKVFACLLEKQFTFMRNGDRFWYSHAPNPKLGTQITAFTEGKVLF